MQKQLVVRNEVGYVVQPHSHETIPVVTMPAMVPSCYHARGLDCGMKLKAPCLPLKHMLMFPFTTGQTLKIRGRASYCTDPKGSFVIDLGQDYNIPLRLEFKSISNVITANSFMLGRWGNQEVAINQIRDGRCIKVAIKPERCGYEIKVNGGHFYYKSAQLQTPMATYFEISGGAEIHCIKVK